MVWIHLLLFKPDVKKLPTHASSSPHLFAGRERIHKSDLDLPPLPSRPPLVRQASPSLSSGVQWTDLAAIQSLLKMQSQVCSFIFNQATCEKSNTRVLLVLTE